MKRGRGNGSWALGRRPGSFEQYAGLLKERFRKRAVQKFPAGVVLVVQPVYTGIDEHACSRSAMTWATCPSTCSRWEDGWQICHGDWEPNAKFRSAWMELQAKPSDRAESRVWLAPLLVVPSSNLYPRTRIGCCGMGPWPEVSAAFQTGGEQFVCSGYHPTPVLGWLRALMKKVRGNISNGLFCRQRYRPYRIQFGIIVAPAAHFFISARRPVPAPRVGGIQSIQLLAPVESPPKLPAMPIPQQPIPAWCGRGLKKAPTAAAPATTRLSARSLGFGFAIPSMPATEFGVRPPSRPWQSAQPSSTWNTSRGQVAQVMQDLEQACFHRSPVIQGCTTSTTPARDFCTRPLPKRLLSNRHTVQRIRLPPMPTNIPPAPLSYKPVRVCPAHPNARDFPAPAHPAGAPAHPAFSDGPYHAPAGGFSFA